MRGKTKVVSFRKWQTFQEESLKVNWSKNRDSSMVEYQAGGPSLNPGSGSNFSLQIYEKKNSCHDLIPNTCIKVEPKKC